MKISLPTTALLLATSNLISSWKFSWDIGSIEDTDNRDQPFCISISHNCRNNPESEGCRKNLRDPTYFQWDRKSAYYDGRTGCRLVLYSDGTCETGVNKFMQVVTREVSERTTGGWEIRAYKVEDCRKSGNGPPLNNGNGPPFNGYPNNGNGLPPNNGPRCRWERDGDRGGRCEGGKDCRERRGGRRECEA